MNGTGSTGAASDDGPGGAAPPRPETGRRAEVAAAVVCAAVGLALAVAPHLATLARHGTLEYLGDGDDVYYVAVGRAPYHGEAALRDPLCGAWERRPTLYAWLQFVPPAVLTRTLGLGPLLMPLVWRAAGGPLLGLALFALFRRLLSPTRRPTAWALGCAVVCLTDAGFTGGRSLVGGVSLVGHMAGGTTPFTKPDALAQYRVVTPLLNLPALLALAAVLVPPRSGRRRGPVDLAAGVLALAACVHLYFFFWTAAVAGAGLYLAVLSVFAWRGGRGLKARELAFGAAVLAGGLGLGAPQIDANRRAFADPAIKPILQRMSRGLKVPSGHPVRTRLLTNWWFYLKLSFGAAVILRLGTPGRRLAPVWAFTAAGFLMANSAIVTGLEFENFHWVYVHAPFGQILLLAGLALLIDRRTWPRPRLGAAALAAVPILLTALALAWRPYEALHAPEAVTLCQTLRDLAPLRPALARLGPGDILAGPREANVALLLGFGGQLYQYDQTVVSSVIPDAEVHERHALNAWLLGLSLDEYVADAARSTAVSASVDDPNWLPAALRATRGAIFRSLLAGHSDALLARYRPDALLRPARLGLPPRGGPWVRVDAPGPWALWRRKGRPRPP